MKKENINKSLRFARSATEKKSPAFKITLAFREMP